MPGNLASHVLSECLEGTEVLFGAGIPMHMPRSLPRLLVFLFAIAALALSSWVAAEPPLRAARLSEIHGTVSFSPAGQPDWVRALTNRPLTTGDRLWVAPNSRAELQVGGAAIRLGGGTSLTLLNLDDRIVQVQLSQGTVRAAVRRVGRNQEFEVDTPNLAFVLRRAGEFRINVDPRDDATAVMVYSGRAELYGEGASWALNTGTGYRFYGTDLTDYDRFATRREDDLDRYARERDRRIANSQSARYVSYEVVGYEELDAHGSWRSDPTYGNVWTPNRVPSGWAPYRDGHWAWVDPWGWTWVDDAPWGYAVSHYGRWANIRGTWCWVPGPPQQQAVYAPAQVAFVGGQNFQGSAGSGVTAGAVVAAAAIIGWFALAPRDVYQPSYPVSRGYFERINRSNAVVAPATVTNVYNTTNVTNITNTTTIINNPSATRVVYANQQVPGAVVAMPAQAFAQSQPVAKAAVAVPKEAAAKTPAAPAPAVAPVQQSVQGGAPAAGDKPAARERRVVARTAPPPPPVAFAAQQAQLAAKPGSPIAEAERKQLKPAAATPAPAVSVVKTAEAPAPSAPPPAAPPAPKTPEARKADAAKAEARAEATAQGKADAKADAKGKADAATADVAKGDAAKKDAGKAEAAKAEAAKGEKGKADTAKADAAKGDAAKAEAARVDAAKAEAAKADAARAEAAKAAAAKADAARADAAKADVAKADAAKADAAKAAAAKADAARAEAAKADAAKAEAAKAEAARADAAKADAARAEAAKAEAAKADAAKAAAAAKADAARAEAAKAEAARAEAAKADAARAAAAKADAAKAEAKAAAARADVANAEGAKDPAKGKGAKGKAEDEKKKAE